MGKVAPLDFDFKHDPNARERIDDTQGDELAKKKQRKAEDEENKFNKDESNRGFRTVSQILMCPVPYDSMVAEKGVSSGIAGLLDESEPLRRFYYSQERHGFTMPDGINFPLYGQNHHAYTLGHDPIFGWIFGTINIMTRSMTLKTLH